MIFKEFQIRVATNRDIPSIKNVVFLSLKEFGLNPDEQGKDKDLNDIENSYLAGNGFFGVVVNTETKLIIGCFGLFPVSQHICELRKMYLLNELRGKGLGKFIMDTAIQVAKDKHYKKIILETISPLTVAIAQYKQYGFREIQPKEMNERVDQAFELDI